MNSDNNNVNRVSSEEVAILLQPVLVDLTALTLHAKQAHWHVQGRHFTPIHEQLGDTIAQARQTLAPLESVDLVTQDLVVESIRNLEEHRWMFAAQVSV